MHAVLEENLIDRELLWRLGKVVTLWASLESWLGMLHGTLLGADLGATSYVTNAISDALQAFTPTKSPQRLASWLF